jgi:proline- and glutamine-rich splicing factor
LDYQANAEKAKIELDGQMRKGRALKVRSAPHSAAVKVKNLTRWVTNELLEKAFTMFGEIERAVVITDAHGKSMGEGIIEFARKEGAQMALQRCTEGCFFLTKLCLGLYHLGVLNMSVELVGNSFMNCINKRKKLCNVN